MTRKRICKCGKVYFSDDFKCQDCRKWLTYLESHPRRIKPVIPRNEIIFVFEKSWLVEKEEQYLHTTPQGTFRVDNKDKTHYAILIHLYNFKILDVDVCKHICSTISHEYMHKAIIEASDWQTSKAADNGILIKLDNEGYL